MRRSLVPIALAVSMLGCAPATGSRDYYVEVDDTVIDPYGVTQPALCADYVTFTGDIDTRCGARPMTWSFAESVLLDCTYKDSAATMRYYADTYYFPDGYIREPNCNGAVAYLAGPEASGDQSDLHRDSQQPRVAQGRVILPAPIRLDATPTPRAELHDAITRHIADDRGI